MYFDIYNIIWFEDMMVLSSMCGSFNCEKLNGLTIEQIGMIIIYLYHLEIRIW